RVRDLAELLRAARCQRQADSAYAVHLQLEGVASRGETGGERCLGTGAGEVADDSLQGVVHFRFASGGFSILASGSSSATAVGRRYGSGDRAEAAFWCPTIKGLVRPSGPTPPLAQEQRHHAGSC